MRLSPAESDTIDRHVAAVEARTGVQVCVAVVSRSDGYVELPWKAFALGASLAGLGVVIADMRLAPWATPATALLHVVTVLGVAAACALLAVFVPAFARLFLRQTRRQAAVKEHAESLFLRHELFRTSRRRAVLILISQFERRVEILPDTGLHRRVDQADWRQVIAAMAPHLREARPFHALEAGIAEVERVLVSRGFHADADASNEVPNRPIQESGA